MGKWSNTRFTKDGPFRPGKTAEEKANGVWAQHRANKNARAEESRGKK